MAITVEQLISKVSVHGANQFVVDMDKVAGASARAASRIGNVFAGIGRSLLSPGALLGGAGLLGVLFGLGGQALKASADFEDLRSTLDSLTGSADLTGKKLEFIRRLDIPAKAGFDKLAEAGVALESFGLRIEKTLPLVAKLQAAFPTKDIQEAVRLFGRLAQGDFPDIEVLSGFGLSKAQFKGQGIKFDSNGVLLSSAKETLDALERIVDSKYGNILEKIAGNTNSKLASLASAWQSVMRKAGDAIKILVLPVIEKLTARLNDLATNGGIERFAQSFIKNFAKIGLALLEVMGWVGLFLIGFGLLTKNLAIGLTGAAMLAASIAGSLAIVERLKSLKKDGLGYNPNIPLAPPLPGAEVPADTNPEMGWGQVSDPMRQIAANTRATAENTKKFVDLARGIFGGGDLGRLGVTPVEMFDKQLVSAKRRGLV